MTSRKLFPIPLISKGTGKQTDVTIFLDEGQEYRLGKLSFTDVELFRSPTVLERVFQMQQGDVFWVFYDRVRRRWFLEGRVE